MKKKKKKKNERVKKKKKRRWQKEGKTKQTEHKDTIQNAGDSYDFSQLQVYCPTGGSSFKTGSLVNESDPSGL